MPWRFVLHILLGKRVSAEGRPYRTAPGGSCPQCLLWYMVNHDTVLSTVYSDAQDLGRESLKQQFEIVRRRTSQNGTFIQGSHVLQFGDLSIDKEPVGNYQGHKATGKRKARSLFRLL